MVVHQWYLLLVILYLPVQIGLALLNLLLLHNIRVLGHYIRLVRLVVIRNLFESVCYLFYLVCFIDDPLTILLLHIFEPLAQMVYFLLLPILLSPVQNRQNLTLASSKTQFGDVVFTLCLDLPLDFGVLVLHVFLEDVCNFVEVLDEVAPGLLP